ncbi:hypothetical protein BX666DRAFT_1917464 [Dichotomocladium elegans]|nr:hypothetical protein BX666DRAFT_1917464 [Dichotomocladium elegans]
MHRSVVRQLVQQQRRYASDHAPIFTPPKGSRATPKIVTKRRIPSTSLPSHLGNPEKQPTSINALSPKKQYREQLRQTRHEYAHELLGKYGQREVAAATKRATNEARVKLEKEAMAKEREEADAHEAEIAAMLDLDVADMNTSGERRRAMRQQNREQHAAKLSEERRKYLLKIYKSSEQFITLDNLDAKIDDLLKKPPHRMPYVGSLEQYIQSATTSPNEIERRKEILKEAMGL